jgi:hypothetical protein
MSCKCNKIAVKKLKGRRRGCEKQLSNGAYCNHEAQYVVQYALPGGQISGEYFLCGFCKTTLVKFIKNRRVNSVQTNN